VQNHSAVVTHVRRAVWLAPETGRVRCNVDALISKDRNCYSMGMCLRDDSGSFIRAKTMWWQDSPLPHEVDACGLNQIIIWLRNFGFSSTFIELDNKLVVDGVAGKSHPRSKL
jgi:hypothetical protein